jgi:hypothetical protein
MESVMYGVFPYKRIGRIVYTLKKKGWTKKKYPSQKKAKRKYQALKAKWLQSNWWLLED